MRIKIIAILASLSMVSVAPAGALDANTDQPSACDSEATISLQELDSLTTSSCEILAESIEIEDSTFAIPEEGVSVTREAQVAEGFTEVPDVTIVNIEGDIGAIVDDIEHGSLEAIATLLENETLDQSTPMPRSATTSAKCDVSAPYNTKGWWNSKVYNWRYNKANEPDTAVLTQIQNASNSIKSGASVPCGAIPNGLITNKQGTTGAKPAVGANLGCGSTNGVNSVGWGVINDSGTLAATCAWQFVILGDFVEADILFDTGWSWFTGTSGCTGTKYDVRSVALHEFGHAVGLQHVAQRSDQVMKPTIGPCALADRNLGRGDQRGLLKLYGSVY